MQQIAHEGGTRAGLLDGVAIGSGHVEGDGFDRAESLRREFGEEAQEGGVRAIVAHPDDATGLEVQHGGHVAMDADLIDGEEPKAVVAGGAHFLKEPALVDLLHRVPGEAEVLCHLIHGQVLTQLAHGTLQSASRAAKGIEEIVSLDPDPASRIPHLPVRDVRLQANMGEIEVPDATDVIAVGRLRHLPASEQIGALDPSDAKVMRPRVRGLPSSTRWAIGVSGSVTRFGPPGVCAAVSAAGAAPCAQPDRR